VVVVSCSEMSVSEAARYSSGCVSVSVSVRLSPLVSVFAIVWHDLCCMLSIRSRVENLKLETERFDHTLTHGLTEGVCENEPE